MSTNFLLWGMNFRYPQGCRSKLPSTARWSFGTSMPVPSQAGVCSCAYFGFLAEGSGAEDFLVARQKGLLDGEKYENSV